MKVGVLKYRTLVYREYTCTPRVTSAEAHGTFPLQVGSPRLERTWAQSAPTRASATTLSAGCRAISVGARQERRAPRVGACFDGQRGEIGGIIKVLLETAKTGRLSRWGTCVGVLQGIGMGSFRGKNRPAQTAPGYAGTQVRDGVDYTSLYSLPILEILVISEILL